MRPAPKACQLRDTLTPLKASTEFTLAALLAGRRAATKSLITSVFGASPSPMDRTRLRHTESPWIERGYAIQKSVQPSFSTRKGQTNKPTTTAEVFSVLR